VSARSFLRLGSGRPLPEGERTGRARRAVPVLAVAALLTVSFLIFPAAPPDNEVDSSLASVLNYAHQQGLQFGPELVFTYGPLGFLMFLYYSAHAAGLRLAVQVAVCLSTAVGLCLVAWRLRPLWRWGLLALFFGIAPNVPTRPDLVLNTALLCWGLLCFVEGGRRLRAYVLMFALLAAFAALAKVSFLFGATASVGLMACDLVLRGRRRLALGLMAAFAGAWLAGWQGSGQAVGNLGAYFAQGLAIAKAYNGALGWEGPVLLEDAVVGLAVMALGLVILRAAAMSGSGAGRWSLRGGLVLAWLLLLSFGVWKHGCVRAGREMLFLGFITVLGFALEALPCERRLAGRWARGLAVAVAALSLITMQLYCFVGWPGSLWVPFQTFRQNLAWLLNPADYQRRMEAGIESNRREAQLPRCSEAIGRASVDVFGEWQAYALHNGWNYRPRPVFQSYVACSQPLMQLNQQFYLSPAAPEYVLFRLFGFDQKFAPLEDAPLLRTLLANYQPIVAEGPFLLLKHAATTTPAVELVREGTVQAGQAIDLRQFGDTDLWLEAALEPTWLGRLRQVLYRPPTVRLAAWREPGGKLMVRKRAPAQMLAAGFLLSPLLLNNEDVLNLYAGRATARPGACAVELLPGERRYWQDALRYRLYKVPSRLGRSLPAEVAARLYDSLPGKPAAGAANAKPPAAAAGTNAARPFVLFREHRWRPQAPPLGGWDEHLAFALFLAAPIVSLASLRWFFRRLGPTRPRTSWGQLALGNFLVLLCLLTVVLLVGESYFRFFCDTTDSLAYTKISERWVQRHWHVNRAGCRDNVEYDPARQPGKRRISFVGDSFTAGHGIKDVEDRFPNRLRRAHPEWEVHVLATVGLDTGAELALVRKAFAKGYQADQVVLVYCLNDIGDLLPPQTDAMSRVVAKLDASPWLVRNSYMLNLGYHHYMALRDPYLGNYCSFVHEAYSGPLWDQQRQRLKAFRDLVQEHGGHLAVVTFPFLHALGPRYEYRFIHEKLDGLWRELGVPHLDLLPVFEGLPSSALTVNRYDAHPNERANQMAAEAIDQWLAASKPGPN
jgi:lysophospholipase L1-like esterase